MTLDGTVNKTAMSLLILMSCAFYTFTNNNTSFIWLGIIAGTILAFVTIFNLSSLDCSYNRTSIKRVYLSL